MGDCFYVKSIYRPKYMSDVFMHNKIYLARLCTQSKIPGDRDTYYDIWEDGYWSGGWISNRFKKLPEDQQEMCRLVYG